MKTVHAEGRKNKLEAKDTPFSINQAMIEEMLAGGDAQTKCKQMTTTSIIAALTTYTQHNRSFPSMDGNH